MNEVHSFRSSVNGFAKLKLYKFLPVLFFSSRDTFGLDENRARNILNRDANAKHAAGSLLNDDVVYFLCC